MKGAKALQEAITPKLGPVEIMAMIFMLQLNNRLLVQRRASSRIGDYVYWLREL